MKYYPEIKNSIKEYPSKEFDNDKAAISYFKDYYGGLLESVVRRDGAKSAKLKEVWNVENEKDGEQQENSGQTKSTGST